MRRRSVLYGSLAIAAVGLFIACGEDPPPTTPSRPTASPFAAIQVSGPESVATGQTAQFVANIRQADGTTKAATIMPNLRWRSSNTTLMTVSSSGVVIASLTGKGEATVIADILPQGVIRGTREVVVQPQGTYRLVGSVRESDAPTVPVQSALVEVIPGNSSLRTVTDSAGQFRLYGVPAQSSIRITGAGYETLEQALELNANVTRTFTLNVNGPRLALNGPFTISLDVMSPCSLSSALQHRTYDAVLTTTGTLVDVVLTEPRFRLDSSGNGNRFSGRVHGGGATFTLPYYFYYYYGLYGYPSIVERLGDSSFLAFEGQATTTGTAAGVTGTLSGDIINWDSRFPDNPRFLGGCFGNIQFRVTPR